MLELPLQRIAVDEGASFGAALLGGVAAGAFADVHEAVAACVRPGEIVEPVAAWIEPYREARERFVALYPALRAARVTEPVLLCDLDGVLVDLDARRSPASTARGRGGTGSTRSSSSRRAQGRPAREVVRACAPSLDAAARERARSTPRTPPTRTASWRSRARPSCSRTRRPGGLPSSRRARPALARARFAAAGLAQPQVCITEDAGRPRQARPARAICAPPSALGVVDPATCVVLEDAPAPAWRPAWRPGCTSSRVLTSHAADELGAAHAFVERPASTCPRSRRGLRARLTLSSRAVGKKTKDPIKALLADIQPALFLGNPSGTVAIMQDKVVDAGGDPDEVLAWVREHGGFPDKTFGVRARQGFDMRPKAASKHYYVVPEDALK